jgi:hypothetical protein
VVRDADDEPAAASGTRTTNLTLPYTSVFLELDCGYWSPEAEQRLRDAIKEGRK